MVNNKFFIEGVLPKAFTSDENKKYFLLFKNGDESAKELIAKHNIRLIINVINKRFYDLEILDRDEMFNIGLYALAKAIHTFDVLKGYEFSTYASKIIENEILMEIRALRHTRNKEFSKDIPEIKNIPYSSLKNIVCWSSNLEENYFDYELKQKIKESLDTLTERERFVVEMYFGFKGKRLNNRQIGEIIGLASCSISKIKNQALLKISDYLLLEGFIESKVKIK